MRCHRHSREIFSAHMVDIHCHVLPGLDDGPESLEMSIAMCEMAIADGITHVIATPHADSSYAFQPDLIRRRRDELQERFEGTRRDRDRLRFSFELREHRGFAAISGEIHTESEDAICSWSSTIIRSRPAMDQTLHHLQLYGATPIITHPERNPLIRNNTERLYRWIRTGCYVQITAQSILGKFGAQAMTMAESWLERRRGAFFCERRAQRYVAPSATKGSVREGRGEERKRGCGGAFRGKSARGF